MTGIGVIIYVIASLKMEAINKFITGIIGLPIACSIAVKVCNNAISTIVNDIDNNIEPIILGSFG